MIAELINTKKIHEDCITANGKTIGENNKGKFSWNRKVIKEFNDPLKKRAGFKMLKGNLFDSAIMKTSVISEEFRQRYLSNPKDPNAFEAKAIVFAVAHQAFVTQPVARITSLMKPDGVLIDVKCTVDAQAYRAAGVDVWRL